MPQSFPRLYGSLAKAPVAAHSAGAFFLKENLEELDGSLLGLLVNVEDGKISVRQKKAPIA